MDTGHTGLLRQPFDPRGQPVVFVQYQSQLAAHNFLHKVLNSNRGIGVFFGPQSSGKKTIVRHFVRSVPDDLSMAMVDGTGLTATQLAEAMFAQFGHPTSFESAEESWIALTELLTIEMRNSQTPLLVVENINKMNPSVLGLLCKLAELSVQRRFSLRMILMSNKAPFAIMHAPSMTVIASRTVGTFALGPMTRPESSNYLCAKLLAAGCTDPDSLLPVTIRNKLHVESGGWPGPLDNAAMRAIEQAEEKREEPRQPAVKPATDSPPRPAVVDDGDHPKLRKLFLTFNRKTLREIDLEDTKILIGRSELCDISIKSRFVSKHHALLVRIDDTMHLLDLNSTNGTFVNSHRIREKVLRHGDVISIGNHGIKLIYPAYRTRSSLEDDNLADTVKMKTVDDMRQAKSEPGADIAPAEKTGTESSD